MCVCKRRTQGWNQASACRASLKMIKMNPLLSPWHLSLPLPYSTQISRFASISVSSAHKQTHPINVHLLMCVYCSHHEEKGVGSVAKYTVKEPSDSHTLRLRCSSSKSCLPAPQGPRTRASQPDTPPRSLGSSSCYH